MTEEIMKLSDIEPLEECPSCGGSHIKRSSTFDKSISLWDLHERCIVCNWSRTFVNVKAG